jgi:hypothetical protein
LYQIADDCESNTVFDSRGHQLGAYYFYRDAAIELLHPISTEFAEVRQGVLVVGRCRNRGGENETTKLFSSLIDNIPSCL